MDTTEAAEPAPETPKGRGAKKVAAEKTETQEEPTEENNTEISDNTSRSGSRSLTLGYPFNFLLTFF